MEKSLQKKIKHSMLLLMAAIFIGFSAYAQSQKITGKVTSADNSQPLPGVSIKIKDGKTGTMSAIDGSFAVDAKPGDVLVFSFIGYTTRQMLVGSGNIVNVTLNQITSNLN